MRVSLAASRSLARAGQVAPLDSGDCAAVDPNVKAQDGGVLSEKKNACLDNKLVTGACLGGSEVKVVGCMTALGSRAINLAMFTRSL